MSRPGTVPRSRPSRRATAPAPLRVTSTRVEADGTDETLHRPAVPGARTGLEARPGSASPSPRVVTASPVELGARSGAPLVVRHGTAPARRHPAASVRRGWWARLAALVLGRRRLAGRHRPAEVPVRGWSMFAPVGRRPR